MTSIKNKAKWKPTFKKRLVQYFASFKALLTYPFFKKKDNGIKLFFEKNYHEKPDPLIFDGNTGKYLDQIKNVLDIAQLNGENIIDLGCGSGSFLFWLKQNEVNPKSYLGLDFACHDHIISEGERIANQDIVDFDMLENHYVILVNVACYLDDEQLDTILSKVKEKQGKLIVIEPYPDFFWDKHFNGIKPFYRKTKKFLSLLHNKEFKVDKVSTDYFSKIGKKLFNPVSFCILAS